MFYRFLYPMISDTYLGYIHTCIDTYTKYKYIGKHESKMSADFQHGNKNILHTVRKSRNMNRAKAKQVFNFLICGNNILQNIMEKELKSYTGVLLRADLTRHSQFSQPADFLPKRVGWLCPVSSALTRTPFRISNLFP